MPRSLSSTQTERRARRARMLRYGEISDPAMLRIALAERDGLYVGKKCARRPGRAGVGDYRPPSDLVASAARALDAAEEREKASSGPVGP